MGQTLDLQYTLMIVLVWRSVRRLLYFCGASMTHTWERVTVGVRLGQIGVWWVISTVVTVGAKSGQTPVRRVSLPYIDGVVDAPVRRADVHARQLREAQLLQM